MEICPVECRKSINQNRMHALENCCSINVLSLKQGFAGNIKKWITVCNMNADVPWSKARVRSSVAVKEHWALNRHGRLYDCMNVCWLKYLGAGNTPGGWPAHHWRPLGGRFSPRSGETPTSLTDVWPPRTLNLQFVRTSSAAPPDVLSRRTPPAPRSPAWRRSLNRKQTGICLRQQMGGVYYKGTNS